MGILSDLRREAEAFISIDAALMKIASSEKCSYQEAATWLLNKFNRTRNNIFVESPGRTAQPGPQFPRCWRQDDAIQALRSAAELGRPHDGILKPLSRLGGMYGFHPESLSRFLTNNGINAAEPVPATDADKSVRMKEEECKELRQRLVRLAAEMDRLRAKLQEAEAARQAAEEQAARLGAEVEALKAASLQATQEDRSDKLHPRTETSLLSIVASLVELARTPRPGRDSEAAVIRELVENYSDRPGISKSNLENQFAAAKRRLP